MSYLGRQSVRYLLFTIFLVSVPCHALDVGISVSIDKNIVSTGETPRLSIAGFNNEATPLVLDVHVGTIAPDGTIYEFRDWNTSLQPWLPGYELPANFQLPETFLTALDIPGGLSPGTWKAAAALTQPGTMDIVSLHKIPFEVVASTAATKVVSGIISVSHQRTATETTVSAVATFQSFVQLGNLDSDHPGIDQCIFATSELPAPIDPTSIEHLDAGEFIDIETADGSNKVKLSRQPIAFGYRTPEFTLPTSFYQAGQEYTASGTGGSQIGAFNVSTVAPDVLVLSQPDITKFDVINAQQDLELRWNPSNNGMGEIRVRVPGSNAEGVSAEVSCLFLDDGAASVPANLLTQLRDFLPESSTGSEVSFHIVRVNSTPFNTVNNDFTQVRDDVEGGIFSVGSAVTAFPITLR